MDTIDKSLQFPQNPRKITDKQLARLESDLQKFGDLSGVVYCRKNKSYVGGNQRSKIFDGAKIEITKQFDTAQTDKTIAVGFIHWNNKRYFYREVEFSADEFREACIVANNDGGDWNIDRLKEWSLDELKNWDFDVSMFDDDASDVDIDSGKFYSMCEHHAMPFFGTYHFAYIPHPQGKILGLSKIARVVDYHAAQLQIQERLITDIVTDIQEALLCEFPQRGIAIKITAEHLCKSMRGVKNKGQ